MITSVLNAGYVRLVEEGCTGSDLTVVNSARVSFQKASLQFGDKDAKLIDFLAREGHTSPFRHAFLQFECYAPLMVARQWWKYIVGSDHTMDAWNESSRRYITEEPTFYFPDQWLSAPEDKKQGSGEVLPVEAQIDLNLALHAVVDVGIQAYEQALEAGVAPEQARLFLPAYGMYVRWYWTASVASVAHFLNQRLAHDAQSEITRYAEAVKELAETRFPHSISALVKS